MVYNKFYSFIEDVFEKKHDFENDVWMVMLSNTAPVATNVLKSDIVEIAAGNGYTAGGAIVNKVSSGQTTGIFKWIGDDVVWTATGGPIGPVRYAIFYNGTNLRVAGWWDYGSSVVVNVGEPFTVDLSQVNGVVQAQ